MGKSTEPLKMRQYVTAETRMKDGSGDVDEEQFRRRGWRTVPETWMEDGNVYVAQGVHRVKYCITTI